MTKYTINLPIGEGEIIFFEKERTYSAFINYYFSGPDGRFNKRKVTISEKEFDTYSELFKKSLDRYLRLLKETPKGIFFNESCRDILISNRPGLENGLTLYSKPFYNSSFPINKKNS